MCMHLQWLKDDFLNYLNAWEEKVSEREGYSTAQKEKMLITKETRKGLKITGYNLLTYKNL